jgi:uncharacterized protein with NAD-binding domain and iron-sulfur cluster
MTTEKKRIVILGGGCGAMAAACELTNDPNWQDDYEITVYQMGWRLGGKGAAGRNADIGERIEEHGFHIWMGFYNNAFRMIQQVYEELDRPISDALVTWDQAFTPRDFIVLEQKFPHGWEHWPLQFPSNNQVPGTEEIQSLSQLFTRLIQESLSLLLGAYPSPTIQPPDFVGAEESVKALLEALPEETPGSEALLSRESFNGSAVDILVKMLQLLIKLGESILQSPLIGDLVVDLLSYAKELLFKVFEGPIVNNVEARRFWVMLDLMTASVVGILKDGVLEKGYDVINHLDFTEWLRNNSLTEFTADSAPIRACYDLTFGFPNGNTDKPSFAAGSGLYGLVMLAFGYKGHIMWEMTGGMGDTIFTPIYQLLKRRGVSFRFFHKATDVLPDENAANVGKIRFNVQARIAEGEYEPLKRIRNLDCWPNQPFWNQLQDGERLKQEGVQFESWWDDTSAGELTLEKGKDFDLVVLGTSIAPIPFIAKELLENNERLKTMVEKVQTVETLAAQLWMTPTLHDLGWRRDPPIIGAYVEPLDTNADLSGLLIQEDWTGDVVPQSLFYLCGPLGCPDIAPIHDPAYPEQQKARVREYLVDYLKQHSAHLWPNANSEENPAGTDWRYLLAPEEVSGENRVDAQYYRSNVDPDQRYVLTVPGTNQYRLASDDSGYDNLYLAGDWTKTPFNAGCVEAAVISGLMASQAICGRPETIIEDGLVALPTDDKKGLSE